jgi:hypothetical protein
VGDETADYLRKQAQKCRHLAGVTLDKQVGQTLRSMADECERKAKELQSKQGDHEDQVGG